MCSTRFLRRTYLTEPCLRSSVLFLRSVFNRRNRRQIFFGDPNRGRDLRFWSSFSVFFLRFQLFFIKPPHRQSSKLLVFYLDLKKKEEVNTYHMKYLRQTVQLQYPYLRQTVQLHDDRKHEVEQFVVSNKYVITSNTLWGNYNSRTQETRVCHGFYSVTC